MTDHKAWRTERDSMGPVDVPADALWGAQTQRAVNNFTMGGPLPMRFVQALCQIKAAAAEVNAELELLAPDQAGAIVAAAEQVLAGEHDAQFPVPVYQTGSGTSSNMNANEVLANLANRELGADRAINPNDHVNLGQSSNDVVPAAIHLSAQLALAEQLYPALQRLRQTLARRADALADVTKTGRTHLMDAMPVTLGQELTAWGAQIEDVEARLQSTLPRLQRLALGGTAVGTGVNTHPEFGQRVAQRLEARTGLRLCADPTPMRALASQETASELAGALRSGAVAASKIANDLRWMNSGPLAGLGEIALEALQPGSSIMPGKVNPVPPEAVAMACARIIGLDTTVTVAAQSGNFQLNVMLPVIADALLESISLLTGAVDALERSVDGFSVNDARLREPLDRNPILVTALNPEIGYSRAAEIAKRAYAEGRPIIEVAAEMTDLPHARLQQLLDPYRLTRGGLDPS